MRIIYSSQWLVKINSDHQNISLSCFYLNIIFTIYIHKLRIFLLLRNKLYREDNAKEKSCEIFSIRFPAFCKLVFVFCKYVVDYLSISIALFMFNSIKMVFVHLCASKEIHPRSNRNLLYKSLTYSLHQTTIVRSS